jgi:putative aldouronate transport system substrate-binding protein
MKKFYREGKALLVLLVIAVLLSSVCACGQEGTDKQTTTQSAASGNVEGTTAPESTKQVIANFNETGYPIVNEPITLKICGALGSTTAKWEGNSLFEHLTKVTGIKFEMDTYAATAWTDRKALIFASKDLPDLFISAGLSAKETAQYGGDGQLTVLNDLISSYAPNIQEAFRKYPAAKAGSTSRDGNIYALPIINVVPRDLHNRYWINTKWLKNIGKEVPATLDELYDVLVAFKEKDANGNGNPNDEIPVSGLINTSLSVESIDALVLNALGVNTNKGNYWRAVKDGKVYCKNIMPEYKEYLKYMSKLYKEKLLDNDVFVQTNEQFNAKAQQGVVGCFQSAASYITCGTEIGYDYTQFDALTSSLSSTKMVAAGPGVIFNIGAITKANKFPEATIRLLDYCYSEEGSRVCYYGEENVGWKWVDKAAGTWNTIVPKGYETDDQHRAVVTAILGLPSWYRTEFLNGIENKDTAWLNGMTAKYSEPYFELTFPSLNFTQEELDITAPIDSDVKSYVHEQRAKFIIEGNIDETWDAYVATVEKMGIGKVMEIVQKVYDQYQEAMK